MKRFFNFYSAVMLLIFIVGLVLAAVSQNWTAFTWIITGILWFLMARFHEMSKQDLTDEYEGKIAELRAVRDEYIRQYKTYSDKYDAKLKENYDLACDNKRLAEDNERLAKLNMEMTAGVKNGDQEPVIHRGSIKIKRKRQPSPEVDTNIQDKTE